VNRPELEAANAELRVEVERLTAKVAHYKNPVHTAEFDQLILDKEKALAERDALRERLELLMPLYEELKGCKWVRQDGQENKLAVAMANLERTLENAQ